MKRDGLSRNEAISIVNEAQTEINNLLQSGEWYEVEDFLIDFLGLELDYIFAFM